MVRIIDIQEKLKESKQLNEVEKQIALLEEELTVIHYELDDLAASGKFGDKLDGVIKKMDEILRYDLW